MSELYNEEIKEGQAAQNPNEEEVVRKLMRYVSPKFSPWRAGYIKTVAECANFKELKQWGSGDEDLLKSLDVPAIPVDRINRGLDTISGIRTNTGSKRKIVPREGGDGRIASILDKAADQISYDGGFGEVSDLSFESMRDYGAGVRKLGFDPQAKNGMGELWADFCNIEEMWWGKCKKKDLSDAPWICHASLMDWEDAMIISPERAGELKGMKTLLETEWEKVKGGAVKGTAGTRDYESQGEETGPEMYPEQVRVWDFWVKKRTPLMRVQTVVIQELADPRNPDAPPIPLPTVQMREEPIDYQVQEGEQVHSTYVKQSYVQYIVATGANKTNGIVLKTAEDEDHPFIGMMAERKKNGQPRGYIEITIPHQQRINLAWAQKLAFNNKAIKSPLIIKNAQGENVDALIQASHFGNVLMLKPGSDVVAVNTTPNVNLQAIEEGASARADMDFAAAATEEAMRGIGQSGDSALKVSLQQNAALTPLNKWVKGEQDSDVTFWRKALKLIVRYYPPQRLARIVGEKQFMELLIGEIDPMTGEPMEQPIQFPLQPDLTQYDVVVSDQALSDFNKQQSFNAVEALQQSGLPFDAEFRIRNAPIRNTDEAVDAFRKARTDVMRYVMAENAMLKDQLKQASKGQPNRDKNQPSSARDGANASQSRQSMVGGTSQSSPGNL